MVKGNRYTKMIGDRFLAAPCKLLIIILFALPLVLLTGCFKLNIDIGIANNFTAYLSYNISLDVSDIDPQYHSILSGALNRLGWHYQEEHGFTVGVNTNTDEYTLNMAKSASHDSFEEAFMTLKSMLTDEAVTAFMNVDMVYQRLERQESCLINAKLDIPQIVRLSATQELPPELLELFENAIETGAGEIALSVPVSEVISHSHSAEVEHQQAVMTVPIDYAGETELLLESTILYDNDGFQIGTLAEVIDELTWHRAIALLVSLSAIIIIALALVVKAVRKQFYRRDSWLMSDK